VIRRLEPKFVERIWGTTKLSPWFPDPSSKIGEVWFTPHDDYPVLFKFLFTSEKLSVQVHPEDEYARTHHAGSRGKTEMWHVLAAEPGAKIVVGFEQPVSPQQFEAAVKSGKVEGLLHWIPVHPGESYFIEAGTVHAIGAGITIFEIQQHSDITYRLYDYGRPRELHLAHGLAVSNLGAVDAARDLPVHSPFFDVSPVDFVKEMKFWGVKTTIVVLEGAGTFDRQPYRPGEVWQIDAESQVHVTPETETRGLWVNAP